MALAPVFQTLFWVKLWALDAKKNAIEKKPVACLKTNQKLML